MQLYDLLMLAVLIGATVFGARKGLAWQMASIASLVASYFVAFKFRDQVAPYISAEEPWNRFGAMAVLYVATSLGIWVMFRYVSGFLDGVKLRDFDRQLGAVFGAVKGVLLCVVITFFAVTLLQDTRDSILKSRSGHYIAVLLDKADPIMPKEVHAVLDPYLNRLEKELEPAKQQPAGSPFAPGGSPPSGSNPSHSPPQRKPLLPWRWQQSDDTTGRTVPASPASAGSSLLERADDTLRAVQGTLEGVRQAEREWNDLRRSPQ